MDKPLFEIHDLTCAYNKGNDVLKIPSLAIPSNKLIVLLGKSGYGKSTLLETLGLMNNTLKHGDVIMNLENDEQLSFRTLWQKKDFKKISWIRRRYFSFIFQNTNLMPNFTSYENAQLPEMICGASGEQARQDVRNMMVQLGLGGVAEDQMPVNLSGGEKQRLAFVRAICCSSQMLFGDEPTGNLDECNSKELMTTLFENIKRKQTGAMVVSHNKELSEKFADVIMIISNTGEESCHCQIIKENVFVKNQETGTWRDHQDQEVSNILSVINKIM